MIYFDCAASKTRIQKLVTVHLLSIQTLVWFVLLFYFDKRMT